jgi:CII-binding regulator of phage lambda lysogenization HflD
MTNTSDKDIGILIGEMKSLKETIAANHASSETSRRGLHEETKELRMALLTIEHKVESGNKETTEIKDRLEKAEKVATEINTWRERLTGMKMVIAAQWIFVAFVVAGALTVGWRWVAAKFGL